MAEAGVELVDATRVKASQPTTIRRRSLGALIVRRQARLALVVILVGLFVSQQLSIPLGYWSIHRLDFTARYFGRFIDAHTQWQDYLSKPSPEVLFIGDSQTYFGVDTARVAELLTIRAGHRVTVGKLGIPASRADFMQALIYRVLHRANPPKVVVYQLQWITFNDRFIYDPSLDLWQIADPFDPGYMRSAYQVDPNPGHFVRDWVFPYFATYTPIAGAFDCYLRTGLAIASYKTHHELPLEFRQAGICDDPSRQIRQLYGEQVLSGYVFSERLANHVRQTADMIRAAGGHFGFIQYPNRLVGAPDLPYYDYFQAHASLLMNRVGGPQTNLAMTMSRDDNSLWLRLGDYYDPVHLSLAGAASLAPTLADHAWAIGDGGL
jgi:hypothetical protein